MGSTNESGNVSNLFNSLSVIILSHLIFEILFEAWVVVINNCSFIEKKEGMKYLQLGSHFTLGFEVVDEPVVTLIRDSNSAFIITISVLYSI